LRTRTNALLKHPTVLHTTEANGNGIQSGNSGNSVPLRTVPQAAEAAATRTPKPNTS